MDMVGTHLHLFNGNIVLLRNISKELLHALLDLPLQDVTSVLGVTDQVVQRIVDGMGCASESHSAIVHPQPAFGRRALSLLPKALAVPPPAASSGAA